ncbi:MAG: hypothetical protein K2R98_17575 [Gemmataceae bacterium]|nr:hypothetical protein [Gemmataceae bacterium]
MTDLTAEELHAVVARQRLQVEAMQELVARGVTEEDVARALVARQVDEVTSLRVLFAFSAAQRLAAQAAPAPKKKRRRPVGRCWSSRRREASEKKIQRMKELNSA